MIALCVLMLAIVLRKEEIMRGLISSSRLLGRSRGGDLPKNRHRQRPKGKVGRDVGVLLKGREVHNQKS